MASGHVNRVKRPNTWLHRPMLQNVKKALANLEPSTHDPLRTSPETEDLRRFSEAGENSPERYGQVSGMGFGLTPRCALRQDCHKVDTPAACALRGW
ncbi:MAG TPA: hypothetical protein VK567_07740 [Bradyrhizobium sp.]|jgi:hypothetical protein|nr:hypothetical protein [Bradyrhizobium sp.]